MRIGCITAFFLSIASVSPAIGQTSTNQPVKNDEVRLEKFAVLISGNEVIVVEEQGHIRQNGSEIGTINDAGSIRDRQGVEIARVDSLGALIDAKGHKLVLIGPSGDLDNGSGVKIEWSPSGALLKAGQPTGVSIVPAGYKNIKLVSAVVFLYLNIK